VTPQRFQPMTERSNEQLPLSIANDILVNEGCVVRA